MQQQSITTQVKGTGSKAGTRRWIVPPSFDTWHMFKQACMYFKTHGNKKVYVFAHACNCFFCGHCVLRDLWQLFLSCSNDIITIMTSHLHNVVTDNPREHVGSFSTCNTSHKNRSCHISINHSYQELFQVNDQRVLQVKATHAQQRQHPIDVVCPNMLADQHQKQPFKINSYHQVASLQLKTSMDT